MAYGKLFTGDLNMRSIVLSVMTVFLLGVVPLSAQPDSGQPPDWPSGKRMPHHEKMASNLENLRLLKLLEAVELSEEQSERFIPIFHAFRTNMKELFDQRRELIDRLADQVKSGAPDEELERSIQQLRDLKDRMDALHDSFIDDCRSILNIHQLARLVIFQERFEREILESLREFRRHGQRGRTERP